MFRSELILPCHAESGTIAGAFVRELASLARLAPEDVDRLARAAAEACVAIARSDAGPERCEPFHVVGLVTPRALSVALRERGAPFDPSAPSAPIRGRAWDHVHQAADRVRWTNRGEAGMELHLVKYRRQGDVTQHLTEAELVPFRHDEPLAPDQRYIIRRFHPDDAVGVARCVYRSFGYSYGDLDVYYPARIIHLNETGQLTSIVAIDEAGEVVGHLGLERPDLGPIAESSDAVVAPAHRHRHLLERLRALAEEEASRLGLQGLVGYPVTTHPFSQRMEEAVGGRLCGVVLGQLPGSTSFTGIATAPTHQRVSTMLYFKYLVSPDPPVVHPPARHAPMLARIYANLGLDAGVRPPTAPTGIGRVSVDLDRSWGFGEIHVDTVGAESAAEVRRARRDLCAVAEVDVVYLYLPLAQAGTPAVCEEAEADGFFFSGIGPRFASDGDALCLQYVPRELDSRLLEVASPFGQELLAYVTAERARVHP